MNKLASGELKSVELAGTAITVRKKDAWGRYESETFFDASDLNTVELKNARLLGKGTLVLSTAGKIEKIHFNIQQTDTFQAIFEAIRTARSHVSK